nr:DUF2066 domain-containing protein [Pararhodospirillum photometricum]
MIPGLRPGRRRTADPRRPWTIAHASRFAIPRVLSALVLGPITVAGGVFPLALGGTAALVSPALAREPYTAPPIPVDVSADSPAAARQKAIDEGQVKALRALLQSMVPAGDQARLPPVDAARADAMVVDFSLDNERTTAKRYLATITVRFNAAKVDQLLSQTGVARVRPRETPVLILPVYQAAPSAAPLLWEDTNPWGATWAHATGLKEGLVPLVLALGDIEDVGIIDGKRALGGDKTAASRLAARNGAPDAVIVHVQGAPETGLTVTLRGVGVFTDLKPFTVAAGPKAFETALAKVRTTLEESWKTLSTQPAPPSGGGHARDSAGRSPAQPAAKVDPRRRGRPAGNRLA